MKKMNGASDCPRRPIRVVLMETPGDPGLQKFIRPIRQHQHGAEAVLQLAPGLVGQRLAAAIPLACGRRGQDDAQNGGQNERCERWHLSSHRLA